MRVVFLLVAATGLISPSLALAQGAATDAALCRSQLDLLVSGEKLTPEEVERFERQCDCLEPEAGEEQAATQSECVEQD